MTLPTKHHSKATPQDVVHVLEHLRLVLETVPWGKKRGLFYWKDLSLAFLRGVSYALGALAAIAIVIPIIVAALQSVSWVPIVGQFVHDVAIQVERARSR